MGFGVFKAIYQMFPFIILIHGVKAVRPGVEETNTSQNVQFLTNSEKADQVS